MNIAKLLAEEPIHMEPSDERPGPKEEGMAFDEDDFHSEGEEVAISEILDAFHSKDAAGLKIALKSFIQLCRDADG